MNSLVLGAGQQGVPLAAGLSKLGYKVFVSESNPKVVEKYSNRADFECFHCGDPIEAIKCKNPDVVVSCLPYYLDLEVGKYCIENSIPFFNLGGRVDVSNELNKLAEEENAFIASDQGLAPGLLNVLSLVAAYRISNPEMPDSVDMYCGGIPITKANPPLNYKVSWSVAGLINEYREDCKILHNGEIQTVKGMGGLQEIDGMEAFYTSGGAPEFFLKHLQEQGVKNSVYRTLRWPGHNDIFSFLLKYLSEETIKQILEDSSPSCKDMVLLKVVAKNSKQNTVCELSYKILADDNYSAMARATAFSAASSIDTLLNRVYINQYRPNIYADIASNFDYFVDTMKMLGIKL